MSRVVTEGHKLTLYGVNSDTTPILHVRAAMAAIKGGVGRDTVIAFEDGSHFYVRRTKLGYSVYPLAPDDAPAPEEAPR